MKVVHAAKNVLVDAGWRTTTIRPKSPDAKAFARRFRWRLRWRNRRFYYALANLLAPCANESLQKVYFDFAMSSTERGRDVVRLLEPYTRIRGCSYLDVGTAYCGFLVAFQEAGAGTVRGIEYDPSFYEIGLANLKDCALSADVRLADITNAAATADLSQQIDVITCNDVIEHVQDTAALLRQIHRLLSPAGLAYFEIPNGWDASSVVSDAHYGLCGITILDYPEEATAYFLDCNPGGFHGTYWYLSREQYAEKFAAARLTVEWLPSYEDRNVEASLAELRGGARLETVPLRHRSRVREAIGRYLNEVDAARGNADFMVRYATPMWRALVRKA